MGPAVQALLTALACLTPSQAGAPPALGPAPGPVVEAVGRVRAAVPGALVEALPPFRDEAGDGFADEEDDEHPVRPRPASTLVAFGPVIRLPGLAGVSTHPAFHAVARSRFLLCGRLTC